MKYDDTLWKSILEDIFEDFLRFFFPDADELFNLHNGFEYLGKELEQLFPPQEQAGGLRYVDKLVKVYSKAGREQWILVHIEVQGYTDKHFAQRMFTYYYRIWDKYKKPVTAFAILTDDNKIFRPSVFEQSFLGTSLHYRFNTYKILDQPEKKLLKSKNPFADVILTVKAALRAKRLADKEIFPIKLALAKRLLIRKLPKKKIRSLFNFLKYYIRFENQEIEATFEREIETITQKVTTVGIEEFLLNRAKTEGLKVGLTQKEEEKNLEFTRNLLTQTSHPMTKIAQLVGVPLSYVKKVKKSLNQ